LKLPGIGLSPEGLVGIRREQGEIETGGIDDIEVGLGVEVGTDDAGVEVDHEVEEGIVVGVADGTEVGAEVETGTAGVGVEIGTAEGEGVIPEVALEAEADINPPIQTFPSFSSKHNLYLPNQPKNLIRLDDYYFFLFFFAFIQHSFQSLFHFGTKNNNNNFSK